MAELVEDGLHFVMRHQRRFARLRRREIADQRANRALVATIRQQFALRDAEFGEVIVFAVAREKIEIKHPQRLAGLGVGHRVKLQVAHPFVRRFDALKLQAKDALVNREQAVLHAVIGK